MMKRNWLLLAILSMMLIVGCSGGPQPAPKDWLIGDWQMYECEDPATGERIAADLLGVSGGFGFTADHRWEAWRDGWPGGRVEGSGEWELIAPDLYKLTTENWTGVIYRSGDEWYSIGTFADVVYQFWYRR